MQSGEQRRQDALRWFKQSTGEVKNVLVASTGLCSMVGVEKVGLRRPDNPHLWPKNVHGNQEGLHLSPTRRKQ
jgi:hypothetical protein